MTGRFVPFAVPDTGPAEAEAARQVVLNGWLTTGHLCRQFEEAFAERVGATHAVAVNSCTAAMHLALEAVGVGPGDIVVTTPYTFAASAEVIRYFHALPVFVDVERSTCNIAGEELERLVERLAGGDRDALPPAARQTIAPVPPKAVIPIHIAGVPCDIERVAKVAASHGMGVVEDAAHAFPSTIGSRPVGSLTSEGVRSAACFSFYATKTLTTGEGGILVTDDADLAARARPDWRVSWVTRSGSSPIRTAGSTAGS